MIEIRKKPYPKEGINGIELVITLSDLVDRELDATMAMWGKMPGEVGIRIVSSFSSILDGIIGIPGDQTELLNILLDEMEESIRRINVMKRLLKEARKFR